MRGYAVESRPWSRRRNGAIENSAHSRSLEAASTQVTLTLIARSLHAPQTFHEFASQSIAQSKWARAYYEHLRHDEKKDHHAAVRSLAYKWIRIIYRCWKDGKPYDEQVYQNSLRQSGSPIADILGHATGVGWTSVAGFKKLSENNA
jgi:hypothetical protein